MVALVLPGDGLAAAQLPLALNDRTTCGLHCPATGDRHDATDARNPLADDPARHDPAAGGDLAVADDLQRARRAGRKPAAECQGAAAEW